MGGWIKLHRQVQESWIWRDKPFSKSAAWVDLLLLASHKGEKFPCDGKIVEGKRGVVYRSILNLSERWGWDRKKTRRFLSELESDGMVCVNSTTHGTTIDIVNYDKFQELGSTDRTTDGTTTPQPMGQPLPTYKNDKNIKKDKKDIYNVCFESIWKAYPKKKEKAAAYKAYNARLKDGYSEDELLKATEAYAKECREKHTEERYIKHGKTFFGPSTPFIDYLKKEEQEGHEQEQDRLPASAVYWQYMRDGNSHKSGGSTDTGNEG